MDDIIDELKAGRVPPPGPRYVKHKHLHLLIKLLMIECQNLLSFPFPTGVDVSPVSLRVDWRPWQSLLKDQALVSEQTCRHFVPEAEV